jgi:hypothetical protein
MPSMALAALSRSVRAGALAVVAVLLASTLVVAAEPASASTVGAPITTSTSAPAFASFADRLPNALSQAAAAAAQPLAESSPDTAPISGEVSFPAGTSLSAGRTLVVAYAAGEDAAAPLAAGAVASDGTFGFRAPIGEIVIAVLSEGRAVFDQWGLTGNSIRTAESVMLTGEGLAYSSSLVQSGLITGRVSMPSGVSLAGGRVAVAVYPITGGAPSAIAANYVSDSGTYAVGGLDAGEYRVSFVSSVGGAVSEWWDNAPSYAKAPKVVTSPGAPRTGINATLASLRILDSAVPKITGSVVTGKTLKAVPGAWPAGTAFSYQWYQNGVAIPKATSSNLLLSAATAGKKISVKVTGKKSGYSSKAVQSASTSTVLRVLSAPMPKITGTAVAGKTLKVVPGAWTKGTKLTYQWYVNGVAVSKATKSTYTVSTSAIAKTITVVVKGSKSGYATASKRSKATATVKGVLKTSAPKITGSAVVGSRLKAVAGTWTSGTTLRYQWYRDGKAISKATGSTLLVTSAMRGSRITVKVTGSKKSYVTSSRTSARTGAVRYPSSMKPSGWDCPSWAPIKGNASSMIYHVPSGSFYSRTNPEECFSTESAAIKAGYRKSLR